MNTLVLIVGSVLFAGIEPFLPVGSLVAAWTATVAVRRADWGGLWAVLIAGLVRDVLLVERLGSSGIVLATVWAVAAASLSHFDRPLLVSVAAAAVGGGLLGLVDGSSRWQAAAVSALLALVIQTSWSRLSDRSGGIQLRGR